MVTVEEGIKKCRDGTDRRRRGVRKKTRAGGRLWEQIGSRLQATALLRLSATTDTQNTTPICFWIRYRHTEFNRPIRWMVFGLV